MSGFNPATLSNLEVRGYKLFFEFLDLVLVKFNRSFSHAIVHLMIYLFGLGRETHQKRGLSIFRNLFV
jgi:hypothetical protein